MRPYNMRAEHTYTDPSNHTPKCTYTHYTNMWTHTKHVNRQHPPTQKQHLHIAYIKTNTILCAPLDTHKHPHKPTQPMLVGACMHVHTTHTHNKCAWTHRERERERERERDHMQPHTHICPTHNHIAPMCTCKHQNIPMHTHKHQYEPTLSTSTYLTQHFLLILLVLFSPFPSKLGLPFGCQHKVASDAPLLGHE